MRTRASGFTLIEVTIAGLILVSGLVVLAQSVRSTLESTSPANASAGQIGPLVDHQLRLHASQLKGERNAVGTGTSGLTAVGTESIYTVYNMRSTIRPSTSGFGGKNYSLVEFEILAKMTVSNRVVNSATDPVVGYTRFWKLNVDGSNRTGI